jgi:hypothetical protein
MDEDPGAVAGRLVPSNGPAMLEVDENPDPFFDDGMAGFRREGCDEPHPAGIVLVSRVVQSPAFRDSGGVETDISAAIAHEAVSSGIDYQKSFLLSHRNPCIVQRYMYKKFCGRKEEKCNGVKGKRRG